MTDGTPAIAVTTIDAASAAPSPGANSAPVTFNPLPTQIAPKSIPLPVTPAPAAKPLPKVEPQLVTVVAEPEAAPKPKARPKPETEVSAAPAAQPATEPVATSAPKTPAQIACEKRKGIWSKAGAAGASYCQKATRDSGKSCAKATQCEGYCLAKSNTCAPATPLLGCHDILNEDGKILTQCIN
jgi:hypothetical protein